MNRFTYPAMLVPDEVDGGFTVLFRDVPEAITQGDTVEGCLSEEADCFEEALADSSSYADSHEGCSVSSNEGDRHFQI